MKVKRIRICGGAWIHYARYARCARRYRYSPGHRHHYLGFRCCFSPSFVIKRKVRNEG